MTASNGTARKSRRTAPTGDYAIGLDIGGTKIAGGLVNLADGSVVSEFTIPTFASRSGEVLLAEAAAMLRHLKEAGDFNRIRPVCAGVGVAELVDPEGNVFSGYRIAWKGLSVREVLGGEIATHIDSDVRAAALGEARFGAGRPFGHFLYVTVGTGISATLVQDGRPYAGSRGAALVIANGRTTYACPACGTETSYVLEDYASGPALAARYNDVTGNTAQSAEDVLDAASNGDRHAVSVVESAAKALGGTLGLLVNSLDPAAVIVGGGLGSAPGLYWDTLSATIRDHLWQDDMRELPILRAELGPLSGVVGAAASAAAHFGGRGQKLPRAAKTTAKNVEMMQT